MGDITHDDLVQRAETFLVNDLNCGFAFTELHTSRVTMHGVPDAIGFIRDGQCTVLIECKTSVSDFRRDQKKWHRQNDQPGLGNIKYYMAPRRITTKIDLPDGWGLIECYEHGGRIAAKRVHGHRGQIRKSRVDNQYWHEADRSSERAMMYSALRRLHLRNHIQSIYE